jgi:hypothetical protein
MSKKGELYRQVELHRFVGQDTVTRIAYIQDSIAGVGNVITILSENDGRVWVVAKVFGEQGIPEENLDYPPHVIRDHKFHTGDVIKNVRP